MLCLVLVVMAPQPSQGGKGGKRRGQAQLFLPSGNNPQPSIAKAQTAAFAVPIQIARICGFDSEGQILATFALPPPFVPNRKKPWTR
ncbi:hypothetical protein RIN61_22750 [Pseudomonas inefficax]|jgi:hypothetical protein|uniref:hypothetical protein n=1 Tax=Pseudomonas TaxID=286 RepID=UPI000DC284DF|nr:MULTISPECIES: hypothetical protein [Pseudomonas]MBT9238622.1 hypothetical protein [Pseudomonas sp. MG-2]MCM8914872.1 hypothetical protein [Pseudomonas inefficax]RAM67362.1 hypothetical protein GT37_21755 [Pseudomonas putida]WNN38979.1 hypothetical protein RIN61_22750 [Pseudomonas inefficax]